MGIEDLAPIIIFAYNRPDHLVRTLDALAECPEAALSHLHIFCDGPKSPSELESVDSVVQVANGETRFKKTTINISSENRGLAKSIIEGVSLTVEVYGKVIVLEDDIVVSRNFLNYMNSALQFYESYNHVASISGYMNPVQPEGLPPLFFLRGTDCWGWATWKRAWSIFEANGSKILTEINRKKLRWEFDLDGSYPYCKMLEDQIGGLNNSWAIRWHGSAFLRGMVSLFPRESLVENIGFDGSGVHCTPTSQKISGTTLNLMQKFSFPEMAIQSESAKQSVILYNLKSMSKKRRILRWFKKILYVSPNKP
jgi:hypothetical protein